MQDAQAALKDLAAKMEEEAARNQKPGGGGGSAWDGVSEVAALAAKMNEDQLAFQKLMKEQMDRRFKDLEENRPVR